MKDLTKLYNCIEHHLNYRKNDKWLDLFDKGLTFNHSLYNPNHLYSNSNIIETKAGRRYTIWKTKRSFKVKINLKYTRIK